MNLTALSTDAKFTKRSESIQLPKAAPTVSGEKTLGGFFVFRDCDSAPLLLPFPTHVAIPVSTLLATMPAEHSVPQGELWLYSDHITN